MDMYRYIECCELGMAIGYSLYALFRQKPDHFTGYTLLNMAGALSLDIFCLHGQKPRWVWFLLNIPFLVYLYEKILRKYCVRLYRKLVVHLLMLLG